jgi:hypothetical protein
MKLLVIFIINLRSHERGIYLVHSNYFGSIFVAPSLFYDDTLVQTLASLYTLPRRQT